MRIAKAILLTLCIVLSGCDVENQYGSPYACNFIFYTSYHTTSALSLSLTNPGTFVIVENQTQNGGVHLIITKQDNTTEDLLLSTEKERRLSYGSMGANHRLIIGCSNFNGIKAYDGQCSNCLRDLGGVSYPLTWADNGRRLECKKCGRRYDPNTEGQPVDNAQKGDRNLYQYLITHNGELLHVYNGQ